MKLFWKSSKDKKGFLKRLNKGIVELKKEIVRIAEHSDKKNKNKLKDGFLSKTIPLTAAQTISYAVLKKFFKSVTISIIK